MKFAVKSYLYGAGPEKEDRGLRFWEYLFGLIYRSVIPLFLFWLIIEWRKPFLMDAVLVFALAVVVFFQFDWVVGR